MATTLYFNGATTDGGTRWLLVEDGRIASIGAGEAPAAAEAVDLEGELLLPGLVNAHHHLYSALAGRLQWPPLPGEFTEILRQVWWRLDRALDPDSIRASARLGLAASVTQGVTTIIDHHSSPLAAAGSLDILAEEAGAMGVKIALALEVSDRDGPEAFRACVDENLRALSRHAGGETTAALFGLHAGFTLCDESLELCADATDAPFHLHCAEGEEDLAHAQSLGYGGVVDRLEALSILRPGTLLAHGIHLMPGITRHAIERGCRILRCDARAGDIARPDNFNKLWPDQLHHIDMANPAGQAYYDSLFAQYAEWGVDFVKADGVGTNPYMPEQVEAMDLARQRCGRDVVLSISAGCTDYTMWTEHRKAHCEMWRNSEDFWDKWPKLENQFGNCRAWQGAGGPGHWPDADMLPLGRIGIRVHPLNAPDRMTRFTRDEQRTLMTLWCIAQSPLFFGGHLPSNDEWTLSLLTNDEVLAVNQHGRNGRELFRACDVRGVVWIADMPDAGETALALFNFSPDQINTITVPFSEAGLPRRRRARDLWEKRDLGEIGGAFAAAIPPHGAGLYRLG